MEESGVFRANWVAFLVSSHVSTSADFLNGLRGSNHYIWEAHQRGSSPVVGADSRNFVSG